MFKHFSFRRIKKPSTCNNVKRCIHSYVKIQDYTLCHCNPQHVLKTNLTVLKTRKKQHFQDVTFRFPQHQFRFKVQFGKEYLKSFGVNEDDKLIAALLTLPDDNSKRPNLFDINSIWKNGFDLYKDWKMFQVLCLSRKITFLTFKYTILK